MRERVSCGGDAPTCPTFCCFSFFCTPIFCTSPHCTHSTGAHALHLTRTRACGEDTCWGVANSGFTLQVCMEVRSHTHTTYMCVHIRITNLLSRISIFNGRHCTPLHPGDSGYCPVFTEIGHRCGPFALSAIPIGAYEPRWFMKPQHINPQEAVQVHRDVQSQASIGIHWGTFCLTDEAMDEPPMVLRKEV